MRRRQLLGPLLFIVVVAVAAMVATLVVGNHPELGLDLQGGVAIVLEPDRAVDNSTLDQTIEILRSRVDALGVAEPEIGRQGDTIVVQLPGVTDRARARSIVGATAELRFRPVLRGPCNEADPTAALTGQCIPLSEDDLPIPTTTTTTVKGAKTTTTAKGGTTTTLLSAIPGIKTTPREGDTAEVTVVLPQLDEEKDVSARYELGPTELTGKIVKTANARFGNGWEVDLDLTAKGSPQFDAMAAKYFGRNVAIVLDGIVQSAPTINAQKFDGRAVISGDFTEKEARSIALVLRYGALPVQLKEVNVQEVSATLGKDALHAGVIAGLVGLAFVALFIVGIYRMLGLVAIFSLLVATALLWAVISYLGSSQGLALTLAGITGIIVSIGVAVDSNVVYYERIKEEVKAGKTLRSAVAQGFKPSWSTIIKADSVSLIGAAILYLLTVGPVRGFAFFLGLSTALDLLVSWFVMRPASILLASSKRFGRPSILGIPEVPK